MRCGMDVEPEEFASEPPAPVADSVEVPVAPNAGNHVVTEMVLA